MRNLVEAVTLLQELGDTKTTTSHAIHPDGHKMVITDKINYVGIEQDTDAETIHPEHNGKIHTVNWGSNYHITHNGTPKEKLKAIMDVPIAHHEYLQKNSKVGDVIHNSPTPDKDNEKKNTRSAIYKKLGGFGSTNKHNDQYAIVRQHPEDHPDEDKRGKKYLHPLNHDDITAHENPKPDKPDKPARIIKWS